MKTTWMAAAVLAALAAGCGSSRTDTNDPGRAGDPGMGPNERNLGDAPETTPGQPPDNTFGSPGAPGGSLDTMQPEGSDRGGDGSRGTMNQDGTPGVGGSYDNPGPGTQGTTQGSSPGGPNLPGTVPTTQPTNVPPGGVTPPGGTVPQNPGGTNPGGVNPGTNAPGSSPGAPGGTR
jgi:hypothetical protein